MGRWRRNDDRANNPELAAEIGQLVQKARTERRVTILDLSIAIGTSDGYVSHLERGECLPPIPILYNIAEALGCDVTELIPHG